MHVKMHHSERQLHKKGNMTKGNKKGYPSLENSKALSPVGGDWTHQ
jgi:hypothetical protein